MNMNSANQKPRLRRKAYYNIYKPLAKQDAGAALQFSFDPVKNSIFLEAAKQQGERLEIGSKEQFDWLGKIVFKLGVNDIAQLLLLFSGRSQEIKCIHKPLDNAHTSVLEVKKQTGQYDNYYLKLSKTVRDESGSAQTKAVSIYIDHSEMAVLAHFIREALTRMLGFMNTPEPQ